MSKIRVVLEEGQIELLKEALCALWDRYYDPEDDEDGFNTGITPDNLKNTWQILQKDLDNGEKEAWPFILPEDTHDNLDTRT